MHMCTQACAWLRRREGWLLCTEAPWRAAAEACIQAVWGGGRQPHSCMRCRAGGATPSSALLGRAWLSCPVKAHRLPCRLAGPRPGPAAGCSCRSCRQRPSRPAGACLGLVCAPAHPSVFYDLSVQQHMHAPDQMCLSNSVAASVMACIHRRWVPGPVGAERPPWTIGTC